MTSSTDGLTSAGNTADRARLVVPKIHESVWASSRSASKSTVDSRAGSINERAASVVASTSQSVAVKRPQMTAVNKNASAVAGLNSSATVATTPKIQHYRQEVGKTSTAAKSVDAIVRPVSRTARTIQPLAQKQSMATGGLGKSATRTSAVAASTSSASQLSEADRAAIMARAARIREQARRQAEARAKADALAAIRQQPAGTVAKPIVTTAKAANLVQRSASVFAPAAVNPVASTTNDAVVSTSSKKASKLSDRFKRAGAKKSVKAAETKQAKRTAKPSETKAKAGQHKVASTARRARMAGVFAASTDRAADLSASRNLDAVSQGGAVAIAQPNLFERMASAKITISFKFNKQRFLTVLRYLAVAVIIATSGYLAWDTYKTNMSVKSTFGGGDSSTASALSIAGANPATADQTAVSREDKAAYTVPSDQPRYIYIPAINVYARVMSVGVNSKGNIDTPANLNDTAWYDGSAKPGQEGQVFIDGHNSFSNTINASFNRLGELKQGDLITVERGDGQKINYRVSEVETVNANDVDMGKALNPPAGATKGITLMTCAGKFDYRSQTADQRLIVYAVQE